MSNYSKITNFTAKDALSSGDPNKLVKGVDLDTEFDAIATASATKADKASPVLTTPQINDTSADHQYIFGVSELAADRTITLPLLTGNDTFVFADFAQTLTNKTLTAPVFDGAAPSGAGVTALFASPPAIGGTTPAAGTMTTIAGTSTTDATSTTAAAMKTAGGLGVVKKIYSGDNLVFPTSGKGVQLSDGSTITNVRATIPGFLNLGAAVGATIATGVITATKSWVALDTESAAASDDLDTVNGGSDGDLLLLQNSNSARTVVAKDNTGNLRLAGDFSLTHPQDRLLLQYYSSISAWVEVSRSDNS